MSSQTGQVWWNQGQADIKWNALVSGLLLFLLCTFLLVRGQSADNSEQDQVTKMERHNEAVAYIAKAINSFHELKIPFRIYHGSTNSTRIISLDPNKVIDIRHLSHIIHVDTARQTVVVEPNVPMDRLVEVTLKYGLVPLVVPEFPGITVGGSYSGTAGESSSFKHGFFDRSVTWCEIVLANGATVKASASENPDLFYGAVGACGTLGVTTLFEIQLAQASRYVELTYRPVTSISEAISLIKKCAKEDHEYLDGIIYSLTHGIIVTGKLVDIPSSRHHRIQRFTRAHDPWFYMHAQKFKATSLTELVPLTDYLFRYDRAAFWMGAHSFSLFWMPCNRFTRWLLDPLMHTRKMYEALHHSGHAQRFIIQDLALPAETVEEFIEYIDRDFGIYPLWLCPMRADSEAPLHTWPRATGLLINVGVWGPGRGYGDSDFDTFVEDNRAIERKVRELGGLKWLYAHTYYTEEEFWKIYDRKGYELLREKFHAGTLPSLFDKVKAADAYRPTNELTGVLKAILGRQHLLAKQK